MIRSVLSFALCAFFWAVPGHSFAANWTVADLGRVDRNNHCLQAASDTFHHLLAEAGIAAIRRNDWVVYADNINARHDALITCTFGDNRGTRATLLIHTKVQSVRATMLRRRIEQIFTANARRIRKEWVESFK